MLAPLLDSGTITAGEYTSITDALKAMSKASFSTPPLKLITAQEAADLLDISFSQFRALEKEGAFPCQRKMIGSKTVRYRNLDILRYMMSDEEVSSKT